jgi:hypothetical protein
MSNGKAVLHPKPEAWLNFGMPGHETEYVLHVKSDETIPWEIADKLSNELGIDWRIMRKGGRLEISSKKKVGHREDAKVKAAVQKTIFDSYVLHSEL